MQFETNSCGGWIVPAYTRLPTWVEVPAGSELGDGCEVGASCTLGDGCKIGADCKFGAYCRLGAGCKFGDDCKFGNDCALGNYCWLGTHCTFGNYCWLGKRCKVGKSCTLGDGCKIGANTQWMGVTVESWLTLANVDGSGRQIKIVKHAKGVRVEAGCFQATLEDFCIQAASEGKDRYVRVISAVAAAM